MRSSSLTHTTRRTQHRRTESSPRGHSRSRLTTSEILLVVLCILAVIGAYCVSAGPAIPDDMDSRPVRVEAGQTMWDLAVTHSVDGLSTADTVALIRTLNSLPDSGLAADTIVLVPVGSTQNTALAAR